LSERDPVLRRLVAQAGPVRVNPPTETHFAALVRAILYQQLAGAAARAIHGRLIAALGGEVTPERFLSLSSQTRQPSHIGTAAGGNTPGLSPLSPVAVPLWAHPRSRGAAVSCRTT
jgi:DNA-3-methyladenine glycosylase II